jgi:hypothetical protein
MGITVVLAMYIALVAIFLISGTAYFVLGERVLRRFRSRYPEEWRRRGEPTFISFAILGARWWRPVSAFNFFNYCEYRLLDDEELTRRADAVRMLQRTAFGSSTASLVLAVVAIKFL